MSSTRSTQSRDWASRASSRSPTPPTRSGWTGRRCRTSRRSTPMSPSTAARRPCAAAPACMSPSSPARSPSGCGTIATGRSRWMPRRRSTWWSRGRPGRTAASSSMASSTRQTSGCSGAAATSSPRSATSGRPSWDCGCDFTIEDQRSGGRGPRDRRQPLRLRHHLPAGLPPDGSSRALDQRARALRARFPAAGGVRRHHRLRRGHGYRRQGHVHDRCHRQEEPEARPAFPILRSPTHARHPAAVLPGTLRPHHLGRARGHAAATPAAREHPDHLHRRLEAARVRSELVVALRDAVESRASSGQ